MVPVGILPAVASSLAPRTAGAQPRRAAPRQCLNGTGAPQQSMAGVEVEIEKEVQRLESPRGFISPNGSRHNKQRTKESMGL